MIVLFLVIIQKKISANINTQALGVKEEEEEKGGERERERERGNYGSKNSEWVWDAESERRVVYMLCSCCTRLR